MMGIQYTKQEEGGHSLRQAENMRFNDYQKNSRLNIASVLAALGESTLGRDTGKIGSASSGGGKTRERMV